MSELELELERKAENWKDYIGEARQMLEVLTWIWNELITKKGKQITFLIFGLMAISAVIESLVPMFIGMIIDGSLNRTPEISVQIKNGFICLAVLFAGKRIIEYVKARFREYLFNENQMKLNCVTSGKFFEKSLGQHTNENNLLNESTVKKGHERVAALEELVIFDGLEAVLILIISFCATWFLNIKLGLIMCAVGLMHVYWSLFLNLRLFREYLPIEKQWRRLVRYRTERWENVERVKINCRSEYEVEYMNETFARISVLDLRFWIWFINHCSVRAVLAYAAGWLFTFGYGIWLVRNNEMSLGLMWPWVTYTTRFIDNLWRMGDFEHRVNFFTPSIIALKKALALPVGLATARNPKKMTADSKCRIEFIDVCYDFGEKSRRDKNRKGAPVLSNVSFTIEPGERLALIGPTGVGKSTIMKLLLRFMDPTSGRILIDGVDLRELELDSWLTIIGYIPQEQQILDGTLKYNLTYGLPNEAAERINDDEIWKIMRMLQIDYGERLIDGLDTNIGFNGIKLSGGQKQRLMIGAAAIKKPKFMVIDEATSSLDATTEKLVQEGLELVLRNCGALIVTHRLNTVRRICDRFIMMDGAGEQGGQVVAVGNDFEELATRSHKFRELAKDQGISLAIGEDRLLEADPHAISER